MGIHLCDAGAFSFGDTCVRTVWSSLLPAALVLAFLLGSIPTPAALRNLSAPFLSLEDAEGLANDAPTTEHKTTLPPLWRTVVVSFVALFQALTWLAIGSYRLFDQDSSNVLGMCAVLVSATWIYVLARTIFFPKPTVPWDLFALYMTHIAAGILLLAGTLFQSRVHRNPVSTVTLLGLSAYLTLSVLLMAVVLAMPLGVPSSAVDPKDIGVSVSPEDYTSLFGWITFSWVQPLIQKGTHTTLYEADVWKLSPTMQSRPVFMRFTEIKGVTLLRQLWRANSFDLVMDFVLTYVSVAFNYCGPFFLNRILEAIREGTPEGRSRAYIYALLAFGATIAKAQSDLQHLWFGRRAATRIRSELMACIYDKALKRKDYSGIIDASKAEEAKEKKAATDQAKIDAASVKGKSKAELKKDKKSKKEAKDKKDKKDSSDDPKKGADTGKIVNLMAGDANRIAMITSGAYFLYAAPFEIVLASLFLYQLLGWSAFAGFGVLIIGTPLNSWLMTRAIRITKGALVAKDKRMAVLNELLTAVKFVKFFAWEDRWISRTMEAREVELEWIVKSRVNGILFSALWVLAPILVSITSFYVYVSQGNQLTVSKAFTSIALFSMIRAPLNVIPAWIVQFLQTKVAVDRIAVYLAEDEVSEQVSMLKGEISRGVLSEGLGIENASFKWNELETATPVKTADHGRAESASSTVSTDDTTVVEPSLLGDAPPEHRFELKDINVTFPEGQLTVITGPTASGKTAILMALLGELTMLPGGRLIMSKDLSTVDENGFSHSFSYAAQTPWLRHESIKDNITFGYPFDKARYEQVITACALKPDLDTLEDGDATEIGARGVSLSGGQKARVALARAVYARTKYVLLDDPLSAVDSHTSRFLFEHLLQGPLLSGRTVILVTHHVELVLPGAHYLVRMLDGRIDVQGSVSELRERGVLDDIKQEATVNVVEEELAIAESEPCVEGDSSVVAKAARKLIKDEHREIGGVKWSIYKTYLAASSYWTWAILAVIIVITQSLGVGEKFWVKVWGEAYRSDKGVSLFAFSSLLAAPEHEVTMDGQWAHTHNIHSAHFLGSTAGIQWPDANDRPLFYIGIYAAIGLATGLASILSVATQYTGALRASRMLFSKLLTQVIRAPMRWHDVTPAGRMLNRFSKDMETIDSSLASTLQQVNSSLATFAAAILTVAVVLPWFSAPAICLGVVYRQLALGYLNTGRDLRRMESNSRSPIFSQFAEALDGIVTVRAFSKEQQFLDNIHGRIDLTTQMWYTFWMSNRWLLLNFDTLGAFAVLATTLFSITSSKDGYITDGTAGMCITSSMAFTMSIYWLCRFWTQLELDLNSVERIVEYLDLPQEPAAVIEGSRPPAYWPSSSSNNPLVEVENLVIKYAPELPPVLHGVSFQLQAKERIGLLGRTGSGKSTLAMSILRFVEPASGSIRIDGVDISKIGIHDLRTRLTFIPQDATLFSGTLRDNLDPFGDHSDSECLEVLHRVHLISPSNNASAATSRDVSRAPSIAHGVEPSSTSSVAESFATATETTSTISLDTQVSAGGSNFSQGQRQLVALARALLRRSSIIILDEATSSIDFAMDQKIQTTIREEFNDSLLLTVAHRLKTVIDYDRLMVLDKGEIVEFDTPYTLIQKEDGVFRNMCLKSGTFSELEAAAKARAESK